MPRPTKLSDEALVAAVTARPGLTAAQVAEVLGAGQSTVAKRLAVLEATGAVSRTPGGRVAGVRAPDRWDAAAVLAPDEPATSESAEATSHEDSGAPDAHPAEGTSARLGRGALGAMVRDYLARRPTEAFGPAQVGKALGRSQGAVSNALAAMAERGEVVLVAERPRRYRIAR